MSDDTPIVPVEDLPVDTVRVPWVIGTVGEAAPVVLVPVDLAALCQAKVAQVAEDNIEIEEARAEAAAQGDDKRRQALQERLDFNQRRIAWLAACADAGPDALRARGVELETSLGLAAVAYLDTGLPDALKADHRMLDLLGELAIVRLALGA
jgi:hypothetical protein